MLSIQQQSFIYRIILLGLSTKGKILLAANFHEEKSNVLLLTGHVRAN